MTSESPDDGIVGSDAVPGGAGSGGRDGGKAERHHVPRGSMAVHEPAPDRPDPVEVLVEQGRTRVPELVPVRYARMLGSTFTFFRGAAAVMAADLGAQPRSDLHVQLCGDAHLANFGGFAAPDRTLVFDVNDFDETIPGPFEWDVKRLVASFVVAGRDRGFSAQRCRDLVLRCVRSYQEAMSAFAGMTRLGVWYERLDAEAIRRRFETEVGSEALQELDRILAKARKHTSSKAFSRYTTRDADGRLCLLSHPPVLVPLEELLDPAELDVAEQRTRALLEQYSSALLADRQWLLAGYRIVGRARKVVGVGSVGTRCWVVLLVARDDDEDDLVLQVKEAQRSVLDPYLGTNVYAAQGHRVVAGQRVMQATGDVLLGWAHGIGIDGHERDLYVRQLWDWKVSVDLATISPAVFEVYAELCGWTLARAHARSGDRKAIAAYLGGSHAVDRAFADYAEAYADQNERDYARLRTAAADGVISVAPTEDG
jgi:uncharacterized protein (DUF2252 family)